MNRIEDYTAPELTDEELARMISRLGEFIKEPGGYARDPYTQKRHEIALISKCYRMAIELEKVRRNAGKQTRGKERLIAYLDRDYLAELEADQDAFITVIRHLDAETPSSDKEVVIRERGLGFDNLLYKETNDGTN